MTAVERVTALRSTLAAMKATAALAERAWPHKADWQKQFGDEDDGFIASWHPSAVLALVAHAEGILDRHHGYQSAGRIVCVGCGCDVHGAWLRALDDCPEVVALCKAWTVKS